MGQAAICACGAATWDESKAFQMSLLAKQASLEDARSSSKQMMNMISPLKIFPQLAKIVDEWEYCADCNAKHPKWAELTRGSLICIKCSGIHRNLSTDISTIKSVTLDKWNEEMIEKLCESDTKFNEKWEYHVTAKYKKPTLKSSEDIRRKYIIAKYVGVSMKEYKISKQLQPAFVYDSNLQPLAPVFALNESDESISTSEGMREYSGIIEIDQMCVYNLPKAHLLSESNSYVVFSNHNGQSIKTKVIKHDNSPKWQEQCVLSVNERHSVLIEVYHNDMILEDELLCSCILDVGKDCQNDKCVKMHIALDVHGKYQKQNKSPMIKFSVTYNKLDSIFLCFMNAFYNFKTIKIKRVSYKSINSGAHLVMGKPTKSDLAKIFGKIQFVNSFPDFKVKVVDSFPDLKVQMVTSFADKAGKWKEVSSFPDYKIQIVDSFPDFKIKYVSSFPGVA